VFLIVVVVIVSEMFAFAMRMSSHRTFPLTYEQSFICIIFHASILRNMRPDYFPKLRAFAPRSE
jgi:hypothetical protein